VHDEALHDGAEGEGRGLAMKHATSVALASLAVAAASLAFSIVTWKRAHPPAAQLDAAKTYVRATEAEVALTELAWGIASCAENGGALPASTPRVPSDLGAVTEQSYQSADADWSDAAFRCAGFHMIRPQRFRYQWQRIDEHEGAAVADADLDGDGQPDHVLRLHVHCATRDAKLRCRPDSMPTEPAIFWSE
jgi:hypothetical protein